MFDRVQFAATVRAGRAVLGWSQIELARRTALTQRAIYCIEQNIVRPRKQTLLSSLHTSGAVFSLVAGLSLTPAMPHFLADLKIYRSSTRTRFVV